MKRAPGLAFSAITFVLVAVVATACSSGAEKGSQGSMAVRLSASGPIGKDIASGRITISELEAHRAGGAWVPFESSIPPTVDVVALANDAGNVTLPSDLLPEGPYDALQVRIARVELVPTNGARTTIAPPGTGWGVLLPVDFTVASGRETIVKLNARVDRAFKRVNGQFEFEPEFEIGGVAHDSRPGD